MINQAQRITKVLFNAYRLISVFQIFIIHLKFLIIFQEIQFNFNFNVLNFFS